MRPRSSANARALADSVMSSGLNVVSGGTDSHLMVVDFTPKKVSGRAAEISLEHANITCSRSTIPFDPRPPAISSGVRVGTPAGTTLHSFGEASFAASASGSGEVADGLKRDRKDNSATEAKVREEVLALTSALPIYN